MHIDDLLHRSLQLEHLSIEEGVHLLEEATTAELMYVGNKLRWKHVPNKEVTWIIDRNSNTTNVCIANCKFCNFFRRPGHEEAYTTTIEQYKQKIDELFEYGGNQLLLQGGHHPDLGLQFYVDTFSQLKELYPTLKLHALPGAGAEILNDRVRRRISRGKCSGQEWLDVMRAAHQLHLTTSATMMFGHIETNYERIEHLALLREVQAEKPTGAKGFIAFIPWPFMDEDTILSKLKIKRRPSTGDEYIRMIAMSRIMLPNVTNIQASWLTVGKQVAQACLHAGANDFGSIMIEENVVSAAGAAFRFTANGIQEAIREAGFIPQLRTQEYEFRELSKNIKQQDLDHNTMIVD